MTESGGNGLSGTGGREPDWVIVNDELYEDVRSDERAWHARFGCASGTPTDTEKHTEECERAASLGWWVAGSLRYAAANYAAHASYFQKRALREAATAGVPIVFAENPAE